MARLVSRRRGCFLSHLYFVGMLFMGATNPIISAATATATTSGFVAPMMTKQHHLFSNNKNHNNNSNKQHLQPTTTLSSRNVGRSLEGLPSSPGWKQGKLDKMTDWAVSDEPNRPIVCEYEPDSGWLWTQWRGTVLSLAVLPVLSTIGIGILVDQAVHYLSPNTWPLLQIPPADDPILQQLSGLNAFWKYHVTLSTFTLTFFTSEAYTHWRKVYFTTRAIQGRVNDICLLLTIGAASTTTATTATTAPTTIEDESNGLQHPTTSQEFVLLCTRLIKLSHTFFWAATPTCSNGVSDDDGDDDDNNSNNNNNQKNPTDQATNRAAIGPLLLSQDGLQELVEAGALTEVEMKALLTSGLPPSQYSYILLEWVGLYIMDGLQRGLLHSNANHPNSINNGGLENNLLRQLTSLRAEYFSIGDYTAGRMPLAYVQLIQVLVDSLVYLAPFALYCELGTLSIPLTGLLTFFFKGLLEVSKSFLDPFGNEGYQSQNIRVDVLVSELNFGASSRWIKAAQSFPNYNSSNNNNNNHHHNDDHNDDAVVVSPLPSDATTTTPTTTTTATALPEQ